MNPIVQIVLMVSVVALCALLKFKNLKLVIPGLKLEVNCDILRPENHNVD